MPSLSKYESAFFFLLKMLIDEELDVGHHHQLFVLFLLVVSLGWH